jgi:hypothetical protein
MVGLDWKSTEAAIRRPQSLLIEIVSSWNGLLEHFS